MSQEPLFSSLQDVSVFVVGDLVLDEYIEGASTRLSPEAPVPVVLEKGRRWVLGGAANVAANIAAFGARAWLAGRCGEDADGAKLLALCQEQSINARAVVKDKASPTTRKTRVLSGYQQLVRIDSEQIGELPALQKQAIVSEFELFVKETHSQKRALVLSDYGKGVLHPLLLSPLIAAANSKRIPIVCDPKSADLTRYAGCTVLKPNLKEALEGWKVRHPGEKSPDTDLAGLEVLCCYLKDASGARNVVLSLSEKGVACFGEGVSGIFTRRSMALKVADVSGAGDTMVAFLALALGAGEDLAVATQFANTAAGVVCAKLGTSTVSSSEFYRAISHAVEAPFSKEVHRSDAVLLSKQWKKERKSIVFTNGCFDILHAGHVDLLQKARALGDALVVGLNSDDSIKRLKGPERPLQNEADRAAILSGLGCVDAVVLFAEDTPLELIKQLEPDVLVKGGDYEISEIVGWQEVRSWGGVVQTIPLVEGRSTTNIVSRARQAKSAKP
jgi:D-beta-D-heptose 7-phosphate kinase / D-beta-D-heptose 1-phosphate adenosyltransferase